MKKEAPQLNQVVLFHHAFSALFEEISELLRGIDILSEKMP